MAAKRAISAALIFSMVVLVALIATGEAAVTDSCLGTCKNVCSAFGDVDVKKCDKACDRHCKAIRPIAMYGDGDSLIDLRGVIERIVLNWPHGR